MKKRTIIALSLFLFLSMNYNAFADEYSQQDVQRYSAYYSNGMEYLKNQQFSSAINEFRKVLRFSPYDETTQSALSGAYLARAQYYRETTKELKKALNDYKSSLFYAKYWKTNGATTSTLNSLASTAQREIESIEKRLNVAQNPASRLQNAKILRAQGDLAASAYDYIQLKNTQYKETAYENLGNIYKNLNNLAIAMDYYKTAIDINPKNPKLHFMYGVMLDEAQNYEASMEQYNLALQYGDNSPELLEILENKWTQNIVNNPNDAQNYVNLGAIYQKQGNFENAKAQYLKAYQLDSSDETILYNLASLYVQQKNYTEAINTYDKLLVKKPNNQEVLNYKADLYEKMGQYENALKQYEAILALNPNDKEAKDSADNIILNHFSGEKLQNYLLTKAQKNPNSYEAQFNYALELHKNKNYTQALQYYKKALSINPSKEEVYINLAQIYMDKKDYSQASAICQQGLLVLPNSSELKNYLADAKEYSIGSQFDSATKLFNEKQYLKAINEYLKIPSQTIEVKMAIASCYWQLNDYKNANKYYLEILAKEPNNQEVLENSAYAYYTLNDYVNAKLSANKLLALDKTNQSAKEILAGIEENEYSNSLNDAIEKYENGDYNASLSLINKVLSQKPDDEYAIYYKGLNLDELKKTSEAIKQYKMLISKHPEFSNAYYSLALDLDNTENYKEAIGYYEKFLSLKTKNNEKDEMTEFCTSRIKELKDYLNQLNASTK